jgi:hypothetical protein
MSRVGVAVMLCTAIGWPAPIETLPMRTERVGLRGRFTFTPAGLCYFQPERLGYM